MRPTGPRARDIQLLMTAIEARLPPRAQWSTPDGYPDSLALCVIDAIQSMGVRYQAVVNVVDRYQQFRKDGAGQADADDLSDLAATFRELGGPDEWAQRIGNRHRTSTAPGAPLKAAVILKAATDMPGLSVKTTHDLRRAASDAALWSAAKSQWTSWPGQRSGISWHYLNMLAGVPGVKPDRMIRRFVTRALVVKQSSLTDGHLVDIVRAAAHEIGVSPSVLDHAIWRRESGRSDTSRVTALK